jgi:hypothetical protein
LHGIRKIAFNFIQDIFAPASQEDSASLSVFAFHEISKVPARGKSESGKRCEARRERG